MRTSIVIEEYLQLIYQRLRKGESVKAASLAQQTQTTRSTVHATLQRMQRDDLVTIGKKKEIHLTEEGEKKAANVVFRHRLAEFFLYNALKISWHEVHKHAHKLEHALTPLVVKNLRNFLNFLNLAHMVPPCPESLQCC